MITGPLTNTEIITAGFSITNCNTPFYTNNCGTYYILGGPNSFGMSSTVQKTYSNLPSHYNARITFYFMKIDLWNNNQVILNVDSINLAQTLTFTSTDDSTIMKICGTNTDTEAVRQYDQNFAHSSSTLTLSISTDLSNPASVGSWGIYDLTLTINKCHQNCKTCQSNDNKNDCLTCYAGFSINTALPGECEAGCPLGYYRDTGTKNCEACDPSCKSCFGPSTIECEMCFNDKVLYNVGVVSTCINNCPDNYASVGGVCKLCDSTCKVCKGTLPTDCISCSSPKYLMNGMCLNQCLGVYFGENVTATCVSECPLYTFPYTPSKVCMGCFNCRTCVGPEANDCKSCDSPLLLEEGKCVYSCSKDHFVNNETATCDSKKLLLIFILF